MTLDALLKLIQIAFYITAGAVAVLTFIKAKNGLLNSVNTEYQKKVIERLGQVANELFGEFDSDSPDYWPKEDSVKEVLDRLHKRCLPLKHKIITSKQPIPGIPVSGKERRLDRMLEGYKTDPFLPRTVRKKIVELLEHRIKVMRTTFIEEVEKYKQGLSEGKHWDTLDKNHGWVSNRINERLYKAGCGISQIQEEVHIIRLAIQQYLEDFNPIKRKER